MQGKLMIREPGTRAYRAATADEVTAAALAVLEAGAVARDSLMSPSAVKGYLRLKVGSLGHEVFGVIWMDAQHKVIACAEMFRGTITQTSVYPREIVREALRHNAAAVILWHNHPSGTTDPSKADCALTETLKEALALVDCRVIDHMIVTRTGSLSFAERGFI